MISLLDRLAKAEKKEKESKQLEWKNPKNDPLPALMYEAYSAQVRSKPHPCSICRSGSKEIHFHISDLGKCKRRVWYEKMNPDQKGGGSGMEFLNDGHVHESSILTLLHNGLQKSEDVIEMYEGVDVFPASNEEEIISKVNYMYEGEPQTFKLVGHYDGLLILGVSEMTAVVYLLECKAVKQTKFETVRKGEMDKEWYFQMQGYIKLLRAARNIDRGYLIVKNRETGKILPPIRVDYDSKNLKLRSDTLIETHTALINGTMPDREHKKATSSECRNCSFYDLCWKTKDILYKEEEEYA